MRRVVPTRRPPRHPLLPPPLSGPSQVFLSRDMMRLALRMDLLRLLHFYHSGLGYFTTARLMMLGIYLQVRPRGSGEGVRGGCRG